MKSNHHWKCNRPENLPDFIIGGAMKSGTTTLHHILNTHPDVFIPEREIGFFDIDHLLQHPDFNYYDHRTNDWLVQASEENINRLWEWYFKLFENSGSKMRGEDSTSYLASSMAAKRISQQTKPVKLIFVLRHPTSRTYSNYLHLLSSGRATQSFEDMLKFEPYSVLGRSMYLEQLENYYNIIPNDRIKIILFEEFVKNVPNTIKEVCDFLNLDFNKINEENFSIHSNPTYYPRFKKLYYWKNKYFLNHTNAKYSASLPVKLRSTIKYSLLDKVIIKMHNRLNPLSSHQVPKINLGTKRMLDEFFFKYMDGIDELTGKSILKTWFN